MIKLLKKAKAKKRTCTLCRSVFSFEPEDLKGSIINMTHGVIECPVCVSMMWVIGSMMHMERYTFVTSLFTVSVYYLLMAIEEGGSNEV